MAKSERKSERTARIDVRCTQEEKARLQELADKLHLPLSTLLVATSLVVPELFVAALGVEFGNFLYERFMKSDEEKRLSELAKVIRERKDTQKQEVFGEERVSGTSSAC